MGTPTICFINQKGGCGKSSCCFHLGGYFAQMGMKVLLIDADPQGSLSQAFFGSALVETLPAGETLAALFDESSFFRCPEILPRKTPFDGISLVCANQTLARYNCPSPPEAGLAQFALRQLIEELGPYDVALIDCPPNLYLCSWNAMLAADFLIIPVPPEDFGAQGLRVVHDALQHARLVNPRLSLLGHLVTRYDQRLLIHRSYAKKLRELYPVTALQTSMPEASAFKVALSCRQPVTFYAPACKAARFTSQLGCEILHRMETLANRQYVA